MDESEVSPNNVIGKALGKEHSGRVRCLGLGVVSCRSFKQTRPRFSDTSSSSTNSSYPSNFQKTTLTHKNSQENYKEMVNSHNLMINAFKAYMIMKEVNPIDISSGSLLDVNGRSSGDSYSSDNH
ncbi:hypothetical protein P3S68_016232 [Capsicum galapagoense]